MTCLWPGEIIFMIPLTAELRVPLLTMFLRGKILHGRTQTAGTKCILAHLSSWKISCERIIHSVHRIELGVSGPLVYWNGGAYPAKCNVSTVNVRLITSFS